MITFSKEMKLLHKVAFSITNHSMWCAGPSIEYVKEIRPVQAIVETLIREYYQEKEAKPEHAEAQ